MTPTPQSDIRPRNLRFAIAQKADSAWFGGDPVKSAVMDGFAVLLPAGERFFIRSLNHYATMIEDPAIRQGIRDFSMQEAFHTREHLEYNQALRSLGHNVDAMEEAIGRKIDSIATPLHRLAATCAIEQITYAFSRYALGRTALWDTAAPAYRRLWRWHATEELEHSAVALQVYHAIPWHAALWKRYALRITLLIVISSHLFGEAMRNTSTILRGKEKRLSWSLRLRLLWVLFGSPGFARALIIPFLAYLKPGYLGGSGGDAHLLALGRQLVDEDRVPA